jgi:hypothetical protein
MAPLPLLAPALFFFGGQVFRVGSKKMADKLLKLGYKRATSKQIKAAPKAKPTVNSLEDVKKLKGTKVANTALGAISTAGAITAAKPAGGDKTKRKRKAPDRSADTNERQQRVFEKRGGVDAKKPKKTAAQVNKTLGGSMDKKTWRDVKSVAGAKSAGLNHFTGKDGKKKIAVTQADLDKKGMTLRQYANSLRK